MVDILEGREVETKVIYQHEHPERIYEFVKKLMVLSIPFAAEPVPFGAWRLQYPVERAEFVQTLVTRYGLIEGDPPEVDDEG